VGNLTQILDMMRTHLEDKDSARELALDGSRKIIRLCADSTKEMHRAEWQKAEGHLAEGRQVLSEIGARLQAHPDVLYGGFVQDAQKEYAEACIALAVIRNEPVPGPVDLGVSEAPYLNGMAEAIGEIRRRVVDLLREGDVDQCTALLETMSDFYAAIVSFDYPDAVLMGLRRRTDIARSIIEKTRYDLTTAVRQEKLEKSLRRVEGLLARSFEIDHPPT
jgi:translin